MNGELTKYKVAGAFLAGGNARRMGGIPKGMIQAGGHLSLLERLVVHMIRSGLEEIIIVANDKSPYAHIGCAIVADKRMDAGPLAGIEAALEYFAGRYDAVLCLPCDLPALSAKEISALLDAFVAGGRPVVFAETDGSARHPLCAVIRSDLLGSLSAALDRGERGAGDLWRQLGGSAVYFDDPNAFININSPGDLDAWLAGGFRAGI